MAGSYDHLCDKGTGKFRFDLIENMGDAYEACEDCHAIIKALSTRLEQAEALALKAVADEEELPGMMPDWVWCCIQNDRDATERAIRSTVILTKRGISDRICAAFLSRCEGDGKGSA